MHAALRTARPVLIVDVNPGDPVTPGSRRITVPTLLGNSSLEILGYPLPMVLAEKIVTAIELRAVNTRWRDFADVWTLTRRHECSGDELDAAVRTAWPRRVQPVMAR
jgi:Nucleotidyl transferase AbiEii toxin, Type IV TA system